MSVESFDRGTAAARPAAELMGAELGWDAERLEDEVDHYLRRVEAERQSQEKLTDQEADEARVQAPEGPWAV
jgi:glycerol-3-phosphate dehydrogenase